MQLTATPQNYPMEAGEKDGERGGIVHAGAELSGSLYRHGGHSHSCGKGEVPLPSYILGAQWRVSRELI